MENSQNFFFLWKIAYFAWNLKILSHKNTIKALGLGCKILGNSQNFPLKKLLFKIFLVCLSSFFLPFFLYLITAIWNQVLQVGLIWFIKMLLRSKLYKASFLINCIYSTIVMEGSIHTILSSFGSSSKHQSCTRLLSAKLSQLSKRHLFLLKTIT